MRVARKPIRDALSPMPAARARCVQSPAEDAVAGPQPPPLRLRALTHARVHDLTRPETIVGRHSDADLQLAQADVSRFHCRFFHQPDGWYVEDLGSLNGTLVNGDRVQRVRLRSRDKVRIGPYQFEVELTGDQASRAAGILETIATRLSR